MSETLNQAEPFWVPSVVQGRPRVITLASGKGGVGKSHVAINLAIALSRLGRRVLLVDGDLGLANVNVLVGVSPEFNASHLLEGMRPFEDVVVSYKEVFDFLPAGSALASLAELEIRAQVRLMEALQLYKRPYDYVLVDAAAGIGSTVRLAMSIADEVVVVMTPEATSLTDAYALVKVASKYGIEVPFQVLVNRVRLAGDAREMYGCLNSASRSFLGIEAGYAGYIYRDRVVERATRDQTPFILSFPSAPAARCIGALARRIESVGADGIELKAVSSMSKQRDTAVPLKGMFDDS
ncbi:MAG: MinD/ParA family protein [Myxococcota bacterium]